MSQMGGTFVASVPAVPVGSMQAFAGSSAPTGWLLCNGTTASRTTYSNLYSVIGTTYGVGDGSTTFGLPDMRGRVPMGAGTGNQLNASGSGVITGGTAMTARTAGAFGGEETHLLTSAEMPSHTHTQNAHSHLLYSGPAGGVHAYISQNGNNGALYGPTESVTATNQNTGGGGRHAVVTPFVVLNYIIKAIPDTPRGGMTATFTPPIVTSLPLVPQFGDQVVYAADAANGVYWLLQYDASGTYPWKFIGGAPLQSLVSTQESTANPAYVALTTAGPSVTCVLPGDYDVHLGASFNSGAGNDIIAAMSYLVGVTAASDADAVWFQARGPGYNNTATKTSRKTGVAASTALVARYKSPVSAGMNFSDRFMRVTPIRVKAA